MISSKKIRPFHLAIPVPDLEKARFFYSDILGCREGRCDETWVDFDFFGHQLVFHLDKSKQLRTIENAVDGHGVPVPHFGVILEWDAWKKLSTTLKEMHIQFIIEPYIRFKGQTGEQATLFFCDPNGLHLEFKSFKNESKIFQI